MNVTVADLLAALEQVPDQAQLRRRALRRSVDGRCYDVGDGWYVCDLGALTLPTTEEDVEDYHGGWAS